MEAYHNLIRSVLTNGTYKENRTAIDTISSFGEHYTINLQDGFPLVTTKDLSGSRWESLVHEFLWYLSGEHHINHLKNETGIWDAWADDDWNLPSAYGRFWRRYPAETDALAGEDWATEDTPWTSVEYGFSVRYSCDMETAIRRFKRESDTETITETDQMNNKDPLIVAVSDKRRPDEEKFTGEVTPFLNNGTLVVDQLEYAKTMLTENPNSRRIVVNAWHPANATVSGLPPCHFNFVLNVQDGKLNTHLMQRSGDVALGIPFNIASYSLLTHVLANETGLEVGEFAHSITDAHIYCGTGERGKWYRDNLDELSNAVFVQGDTKNSRHHTVNKSNVESLMEKTAEEDLPTIENEADDHVPRLIEQLTREPHDRPSITVDGGLDVTRDDITLHDYTHEDPLRFGVAE